MDTRGHRLSQLLEEALSLEGGARVTFLSELQSEDPKLAQTLGQMLQASELSDHTVVNSEPMDFDRTVVDPTDPTVVETHPRDGVHDVTETSLEKDAEGKAFGRYTILREIGRGGMGIVYAAEQSLPRRKVALKVILSHPDPEGRATISERTLRRFEFEAQVLGSLEHPGVARIYEAVVEPERSFFAMEFIDGMPVDDYIEAQKPPLKARLELIAKICDAVHHAHMSGVLHCDLKPANIMVLDDGQPKVLDFGIARALGASADEGSLAGFAGTPLFMSPEQMSQGTLDARSDVYALGVVAFVVLTGRLPYDIEEQSLLSLLDAIVRKPPLLILDVLPELPSDVGLVVNKALMKSPDDRYLSAAALGEDIRHILRYEPVTAREKHTWRYLVTRFAQRNPALFTTGTLFLLCLVAGLAVVLTLYLQVDVARQQEAQARILAEEAQQAFGKRNTELLLMQAASEFERDPTKAVAWLRELPNDVDADLLQLAHVIAQRAAMQGVAADVLIGHGNEVRGISFAPNGRHVATGAYDQNVRLWDRQARTSRVLSSHKEKVKGVEFSAKGELFAWDRGGDIRVWDAQSNPIAHVELGVELRSATWYEPPGGDPQIVTCDAQGVVYLLSTTGVILETLEHHTDSVEHVSVDNTRNRLAVAAVDGFSVWDLSVSPAAGGQRKALFSVPATLAHKEGVNQVIFAGDNALVSGGVDGTVLLWTLGSLEPKTVAVHKGEVRTVVAGRDEAGGRLWIASGGRDGRLQLWHEGEASASNLLDAGILIRHVARSPNGRFLAAADDAGVVYLWDRHNDNSRVLTGHERSVRHLAFSPDSVWLGSASSEGSARIWPMPTATRFNGHTHRIRDMALTPGGRLLTGGSDAAVRRTDPTTGESQELGRHADEVYTVVGSALGDAMSGSRDGVTMLWPAQGDGVTLSTLAPEMKVRALALSADGHKLAAANKSAVVVGWTLPGGAPRPFEGHTDGVNVVAFSPNGEWLLSGGEDQSVWMWPWSGGKGRAFGGFTGEISALAVHPEGRAFVAAGGGKVQAWSLPEGATLGTHAFGARAIDALAYSPRGETVAVCSGALSVSLWTPGTEVIQETAPHSGLVTTCGFSGEGRLVVSGSEDGTIRAWDLESGRSVLWGDAGSPVREVQLSKDGTFVASIQDDNAVLVWSTRVVESRAALTEMIEALTHGQLKQDVLFVPWVE